MKVRGAASSQALQQVRAGRLLGRMGCCLGLLLLKSNGIIGEINQGPLAPLCPFLGLISFAPMTLPGPDASPGNNTQSLSGVGSSAKAGEKIHRTCCLISIHSC